MIDTNNLRTASLYINNQLLSRGLIRDGDSIDFATAGMGGENGAVTSGRIISILNDLILRRDVSSAQKRDAEHRESLSTSMRALRAENQKLTTDAARLKEKQTEAQRRADIATAAETTLKTQLKSAEANAKALKEETVRMKSLVAQSRASCTTEIRRRDRQIETLKKQLGEAGRSRGSRGNPAITTITVTGEIGGRKDCTLPTMQVGVTTHEPQLRQETNTGLTKLAQRLTEENDMMLGVMQQAMAQLREMSGWAEDEKEDAQVHKRPTCEDMTTDLDSIMAHMRTILTNPSFVPIEEVMTREEEITRLKAGWVRMENRWKDAVHLMDGWRKRMAASGRPVCDEELQMGLRLSPVRVNDVDETKDARFPGLSVVVEEDDDEQLQGSMHSPCPADRREPLAYGSEEEAYDDDGERSEGEYAGHEDGYLPVNEHMASGSDEQIDNEADLEPECEQDDSVESIPLPDPPQLSPLRNSRSAGNRGFLKNEKIRPQPSYREEGGVEDQASGSKSMRSLPVRSRAALGPHPKLPPNRTQRSLDRPRSPARTSLDDALLPKPENEVEPEPTVADEAEEQSRQGQDHGEEQPATASRHGLVTRDPSHAELASSRDALPPKSTLTMSNITAKLAASEKEADAARVRAKLRAARGSTRGVSRPVISSLKADNSAIVTGTTTQSRMEGTRPGSNADVDVTKRTASHDLPEKEAKPEKRKRDPKVSKTASRRRSTLSPWELETLMTGNAAS